MAYLPALVLEDVYDRMIQDYYNTPKKAQKHWKYSVTLNDGTLAKAQYSNGLFKFKSKGNMYAIMGHESAVQNGLNWNHPGREAFWDTVEQNHTGNHTCKNHPIKVPTKPSEPVRG